MLLDRGLVILSPVDGHDCEAPPAAHGSGPCVADGELWRHGFRGLVRDQPASRRDRKSLGQSSCRSSPFLRKWYRFGVKHALRLRQNPVRSPQISSEGDSEPGPRRSPALKPARACLAAAVLHASNGSPGGYRREPETVRAEGHWNFGICSGAFAQGHLLRGGSMRLRRFRQPAKSCRVCRSAGSSARTAAERSIMLSMPLARSYAAAANAVSVTPPLPPSPSL